MQGTARQAYEYCTTAKPKKDDGSKVIAGSQFEQGVLKEPAQGKRTDYEDFVKDAREGVLDDDDMFVKHPALFLKYGKMLGTIRCNAIKKKAEKERLDNGVDVFVYWGATGSGKTRKVVEKEGDKLFIMPVQHAGDRAALWADGYKGEEAVLFDDFNGGIPVNSLLHIIDRYKCQLQVKGGHVTWLAKRIYFTSNKAPGNWWPGCDTAHFDAFNRRVKEELEINILPDSEEL